MHLWQTSVFCCIWQKRCLLVEGRAATVHSILLCKYILPPKDYLYNSCIMTKEVTSQSECQMPHKFYAHWRVAQTPRPSFGSPWELPNSTWMGDFPSTGFPVHPTTCGHTQSLGVSEWTGYFQPTMSGNLGACLIEIGVGLFVHPSSGCSSLKGSSILQWPSNSRDACFRITRTS